ncbi:MAG: cyclic nucleotide-binding domain-containing protein [Magnetococcales bacterium]|nr:cyclic nucleotide-binding domain-containing protein [Magnetococcales bacterium]
MLFQKLHAELGRSYAPGETIVHQGDRAEAFFIILTGRVEVVVESEEGHPHRVAILEKGGGDEVFGEMACFDDMPRSATVRALEESRVLTIDRKGFLRRIQEDPSLVLGILRQMSGRIRALNREMVQLKEKLESKDDS